MEEKISSLNHSANVCFMADWVGDLSWTQILTEETQIRLKQLFWGFFCQRKPLGLITASLNVRGSELLLLRLGDHLQLFIE